MFLKRLYDDRLAQASFLVGCSTAGEAVVIDPNRDAEQYLAAAAAEGARITHVTETHIHADFVSGARELAARTGATMLLSREGGADWRYTFAARDGATLIGEGSQFSVGNVRFDVMHTPGHTPEHLTFFVTDSLATDRPVGAFTGDFIFAGDVGRPDLLERAAKLAGTMEAGARELFRSLRRFRSLPEYLQLWPGHGAGSACGKSLGAMPQTTLGYERLANWAFRITDEDAFVREILAGQPEAPRYFAEMKRMNRDGPPVIGGFALAPRLDAARLDPLLESRAIVIDTRRAERFAAGHLPGTINIPLTKSFSTYAGSLIPYDEPLYLVADDDVPGAAEGAARDLAMIGFDRVAGYFGADALSAWAEPGRQLVSVRQIDVRETSRRAASGDVVMLDVRGRAEWDDGHPRGAVHIPLGELPDRYAELPTSRPLVVLCQSGSRSAIAASLLLARGYDRVLNGVGGFSEWTLAALPTERRA